MGRAPEWLRDGWVPAALAGSAVTEVLVAYAAHPAGRAGLLSVLLPMTALTYGRRRSPVAVAMAASVLTAVLVLAVLPTPAEQPPLTPFLVLLVTLFNLGLHGQGRVFPVGATATATCLLALQAASLAAGRPAGDVVPSVIFWALAYAAGRALHRSQAQALGEQARAARAEQTRDEHAAAAVAAERARIARELHDVIAHALTGIVVQASVAARVGAEGADDVATLRLVEQRGREAMVELRRLLGLLREEGQGPASAPLPSLATAEALVEDLRSAGHEVNLRVAGDLPTLPPALDLAGYRILQEALTNVSRHAPGAPVQVLLEHAQDTLRVTVANGAATDEAVAWDSGGNGLVGMRERVRVYGGRLSAGPCPDGGFQVTADLPTRSTIEVSP